jgi:predicted permease
MDLVVRIIGIITPVLTIAAMGYAYGRVRKPDLTWVNRLMTDLLFPMLIFASTASGDFHVLDYLPLMAGGLILIVGSGIIAWSATRALGYNPHAFIPPMMFTNVANMGLPLTVFAFGAAQLPAAVALFMVFSLAQFTFGIRICAPHAKISGILRGPMLWAMIVGIGTSLAGLAIPAWLMTSAKMIGDAAIPLGLFTLGVGFAGFRVERWTIGLVGAVLCPVSGLLIAWPLTRVLPLSEAMKGLLLLYAALPPAVMNYVIADRYQQEPGLVSAIVVIGNVASIAFVPLALSMAL